MHHHASGFVDHNHFRVFIDHIKRDIFGADMAVFGLGQCDCHMRALDGFGLWVFDHGPVYLYRPLFYQAR